MIQKPNFFIIGAPKCGTTAMAKYLSEHTDIIMANPKEPHYFCSDLMLHHDGLWKVGSDEEYLTRFFPPFVKPTQLVGEASVFYLYSKIATKKILEFNPDAKFIVMIRNPVDAAYALFSQYSFVGEEVDDFMVAWNMQKDRKEGKNIPDKFLIDPRLLLYKELFSFGKQIRDLYSLVDEKNILIISFDDFAKDTKGVYKGVLDFINIYDDERQDFTKINAARKIDNPRLVRVLRSRAIRKIASTIKLLSRLKSLGFGRPEVRLPSEYRRVVAPFFADDIELLSDILGKDLTHWLVTKDKGLK